MSPLYNHAPHFDFHGECLWIRLHLKSGGEVDGIIPNSLMFVATGPTFRYQPKGAASMVVIERRKLAKVQVLGVVGAAITKARKAGNR